MSWASITCLEDAHDLSLFKPLIAMIQYLKIYENMLSNYASLEF